MKESFDRIGTSSREKQSLEPIGAQVDRESLELDNRTRERVLKRQQKNNRDLSHSEKVNELGSQEQFPIEELHGDTHGVPVHFVGVSHTPETFLYRRAEIETAISNAGTIVLEVAPEISGVLSPEFIKRVRERLAEQGKDPSEVDAWVEKTITQNDGLSFFHEIEQIAKKYGKEVVMADPHSGSDRLQHLIADQWVENPSSTSHFNNAAESTANGLMAAEIIGVLAGIVLTQQKKSQQPTIGSTRRAFLGKLLGISAAALLTPVNVANQSKIDAAAPLTYDAIDARNVTIAQATGNLAKDGKTKGPICFIYGKMHAPQIMNYLKNPELTALKYELYGPIRNTQPPVVQKFKFNESSGYWQPTLSEQI